MARLHFVVLLLLTQIGWATLSVAQNSATDLQGVYKDASNADNILVMQDGYFSVTSFSSEPSNFIYTLGGHYETQGSELNVEIDFHSADASLVGEYFAIPMVYDGKTLTVDRPDGFEQKWIKQDESSQGLAGIWRISGRKVNDEIQSIPKRARQTLKVLSDERFQWIAMNTETGEFFGTGGGRYTYKNGKYTEHIEFFSRDNSRVGMKLEFNGEVIDGNWHHSGKSSKGSPIYEIWSKVK
ncbi:hypothetical protein [Membranihabitans marinus]|uniref:hypothetical protein n=1 Tax=Membranihabitans marinus TaxID=1227546 RepID=UPI001F15FEAD|nr:hypothetical protein [Membranihabitans marinus]